MRFQASKAGVNLSRRGFTLVELLLVIGIIAVLAALSTAAAMAMITSQHDKNTRSIMREIDNNLKKQYAEVIKAANNEVIDPTVIAMANGDQRLARVIWIKLRLKQEFPTTFNEALAPSAPLGATINLPPKPSYVAYLNGLNISTNYAAPHSAQNPPAPYLYESSVCLYMALTQSRNGVRLNAEQLGSYVHEFNVYLPPNYTATAKVKGFADDYGNPLVFARWPMGNAKLQNLIPTAGTPVYSPNPTSLKQDPLDPEGLLLDNSNTNPTWHTNGLPLFQQIAHVVKSTSPNLNGAEFFLPPVIVSAGKDGKFGFAPNPNAFPPSYLTAVPPAYPSNAAGATAIQPGGWTFVQSLGNQFDFQTLYITDLNADKDNIYSYTLDRN